ncbi:MAG: VOC family protein [Calditrichaeota bacterium]|nr:MAG: VOC family protein [Calditrichota bacterium]
MNTIGHMEIPSANIEKTKEFYSNLFNWEFQYHQDMDYTMFTIKNKEGEVVSGGGILPKENDQQTITNYVNVEDIDVSMKTIEDLGGKIVVPKTPVPGMGWFVQFTDLDGHVMAIWQEDSAAK